MLMLTRSQSDAGDGTGRCRGNVGMGTEGADRCWVWALWLHGTELEPMRGAPGPDGMAATEKDETAPSGAFVSHEHQRPQRVQSGSWRSQAYPYPWRWRHACTAPRVAATGLGLGADQKAVENLLDWQKGDRRSWNKDVREAHQSNAGGVTYEGASQQRRTKGEQDGYVAVEEADARELRTATTVAAALVGGRG